MTEDFREVKIVIIQGKSGSRITITVLPYPLTHQVPCKVNFYPPGIGIGNLCNCTGMRDDAALLPS